MTMEYISIEEQKSLDSSLRTARIILLSMLLTIVGVLVIARFITPGEWTPGSETWSRPVYSGVMIAGLLAVVARRFAMSPMILGAAKQRGLAAVLQTLLTMTIMLGAVAEMVGFAGLIFYLLTGDYQYSWRLGIVSLLLGLYSFPRRREWEKAVAEIARPV